MRTRRSRGDSPMCAGLIAVFRRREGRIIPGGSTPLEKGTARWVRNYDLWRKERKVQETNRHELRYDVVVVGGGSAGSSAALVLGRSRRQTLVVDAGEPRNAPSSGVHGFFSRDGISPEELLEIGREQLEPYPSVEVRSERVIGTSGENGDLEVILDDGSVVRARDLVLATDGPANLNEEGRRTLRVLDIQVREERISYLEGGPSGVAEGLRRIHFEDGSSLEREVAAPVADEGRALGRLLAGVEAAS